ncbi:MAG: DUF262 domain-containing protein [Selenomonadaceae bacterium]|nr:DUF262 domain-containing protein [Selenomonadaceae bacterium]
MSKLNIDQQTIKELFSNKKTDFLISDYQRPYAWGEKECQTLWDDLRLFAFPDNDCNKFDSESEEYFLGPIVMFKQAKRNRNCGISSNKPLPILLCRLPKKYRKSSVSTIYLLGQIKMLWASP